MDNATIIEGNSDNNDTYIQKYTDLIQKDITALKYKLKKEKYIKLEKELNDKNNSTKSDYNNIIVLITKYENLIIEKDEIDNKLQIYLTRSNKKRQQLETNLKQKIEEITEIEKQIKTEEDKLNEPNGKQLDQMNDAISIMDNVIRDFKLRRAVSSVNPENDSVVSYWLAQILWTIYTYGKSLLIIISGSLGIHVIMKLIMSMFIHPLYAFYSILALITIGSPLALQSSSIKNKLEEYINKHKTKSDKNVNGILKVFYDKHSNSKGYFMNGYNFGFSNNSSPFTSKDSVDMFIKNISQQLKTGNNSNNGLIKEINIGIKPFNNDDKITGGHNKCNKSNKRNKSIKRNKHNKSNKRSR
jgi:hypothetical protein